MREANGGWPFGKVSVALVAANTNARGEWWPFGKVSVALVGGTHKMREANGGWLFGADAC